MPDCPGAGSGDWRDYDQGDSVDCSKQDKYQGFKRWAKNRGFQIKVWGFPSEGDYFVPDDEAPAAKREISQATYSQLYGTTEMIPANFDAYKKYYVLEKIT